MNAPVAISGQSVTVALIHPISVNNIFTNKRGGGRTITARYRTWRREAENKARGFTDGVAVRLPNLLGQVHIHLFVEEPSTNIDGDNCVKAYFDLLVHLGVIEDDNRKIVRGFAFDWTTKGQGRAVITPIPHRERG